MQSLTSSTPDLYLEISLVPVPKARPRFAKGGWAYTDKRTKEFEDQCRNIFKASMVGKELFDSPLSVLLEFSLAAPKKPRWAWPAGRPDLDNLAKSITDAGNKVLWTDDGLLVEQVLTKHYGTPGIKVSIWKMNV